jgi:hypothetical protein
MDFTDMQAGAWALIVNQMEANPKFCAINGASLNGPGSSIEYTKGLRENLPRLLRHYRVGTVLDAPCGDWTWMQTVDISFLHSYIGMDSSERIIHRNQMTYMNWRNVTFVHTNLLKKRRFPKVDLILCRDFLAHLPNEYISAMLEKFAGSGSTYLLASNYPGSSNKFDYDPETYECPWLGYMERSHDLTDEPFGLRRIDGIPEQQAPGGVIAQDHELALFAL